MSKQTQDPNWKKDWITFLLILATLMVIAFGIGILKEEDEDEKHERVDLLDRGYYNLSVVMRNHPNVVRV